MATKQKSNWELRETVMYKALERGTMAISDVEILATLVDDETTAKNILNSFTTLQNLATAGIKELMRVKGVSKIAALRVVGCFELARRKSADEVTDMVLNHSEKVANYLAPRYADCQQEIFTVLYLNNSNSGGVATIAVKFAVGIFKANLIYGLAV